LTSQSAEGKRLFGTVLTDQDNSVSSAVSDWLQAAQCHFMRRLGEYDEARTQLEALIARLLSASIDGTAAAKSRIADQDKLLAAQAYIFASCVLGWVNYEQGKYESAQHYFFTAHAQAERVNDRIHLMEAHNGLGAVAFSEKRYASARVQYEAALMHAKQQADLHYTAIILGNLAAHAQITGAFSEAERYLQKRLEIDEKTQNMRQMAISYQRLGQLALVGDTYTKTESYLRQSLDYFRQLGNSPETAHVLLDLSQSLLCQRRIKEAEEQCLYSLQLAMQAQMTPRILAALALLAEIRIAEEKKEDAFLLLQMVDRNTQLPAATWQRAQKLQNTLIAELGESAITPIRQALAGQSLQEFGTHLLMLGH
ncbi:MAG: tetratricopeptide repeat protein, partial [Caldilineaceae bacterium]